MRAMGDTAPAPTCLTEGQAVFIGSCIGQMPLPGVDPETHAAWCAALMKFEGLPYCPGTSRLPIPSCLSSDEVAGIDYCNHGDGSSPYWNALCWGAQKDPAWWQQYITTQPCAGVASPIPMSYAVQPDASADVTAPSRQTSNMMLYAALGLGGLLLLGVGIYLVRKK